MSIVHPAPGGASGEPAEPARRPLVTVALPTYRRPADLGRAIESVLAQDYRPIELIVSDNASGDETRTLVEGYQEDHDVVRYVCHADNIGATANFESLRPLVSGELLAFLGDHDWFDPDYLTCCVEAWQRSPTTPSLVAGVSVYHHVDGEVVPEPVPIQVSGSDPATRVLDYYRQVRANGVFYGITPVAFDRRLPPLANVMGGDMLRVAALAWYGPIITVTSTRVHRDAAGMTVNLATVARTLGLGWFATHAPQLDLAWRVLRDIAFDNPVYAGMSRAARVALGLRASAICIRRFLPGALVKFARLVGRRLMSTITGATRRNPVP